MQIILRIPNHSLYKIHKLAQKYNLISMLISRFLKIIYKTIFKVLKIQRFLKQDKFLSILKTQILFIYLLNFRSTKKKRRRKKRKVFSKEYFQKEIKNSAILPTMKNLAVSKHNSRIKSSQLN